MTIKSSKSSKSSKTDEMVQRSYEVFSSKLMPTGPEPVRDAGSLWG
ncbi:MAG: hypothetical protein KBD64_00865 [Gammaproteobacteria bacterium]|nr:hypothetical protein [Gammaproteobacteria bacterium]